MKFTEFLCSFIYPVKNTQTALLAIANHQMDNVSKFNVLRQIFAFYFQPNPDFGGFKKTSTIFMSQILKNA